MRLWHYELIPYLPNKQLVSQWRELNSIFKYQNKHILINYVYGYEKEFLWWYTRLVIDELEKRHYKIKSWQNYNEYFKDTKPTKNIYFDEHDLLYLDICYYNLYEKFICGQKDFSYEQFKKLQKYKEKRRND